MSTKLYQVMTIQEFKDHIKKGLKPKDMSPGLEAMYEDAMGNWESAHQIAQEIPGMYGNWIHAYLHRKEGDQWNARYWYSNAGKSMPDFSLEQEWEEISMELLTL